MTDRNAKLLDTLKKDYPDAKCELNFDTPFQLLIAVVLSAQCTDKRVNIVTSELFKVAKTPADFRKCRSKPWKNSYIPRDFIIIRRLR